MSFLYPTVKVFDAHDLNLFRGVVKLIQSFLFMVNNDCMAPDPGCGDVVFVLTVLLESRTTAVSFVADGAGEDPFDLGFHFSPSSSAPGSFNTPLILAILDLHHLCFQYHLNSFNTRRLTSSSIGRSIQSTRSNITFLYFCHYAKEIIIPKVAYPLVFGCIGFRI